MLITNIRNKSEITKTFLSNCINDQINKYVKDVTNLIGQNYHLLDKTTSSGRSRLVDRKSFFGNLYKLDNLKRLYYLI